MPSDHSTCAKVTVAVASDLAAVKRAGNALADAVERIKPHMHEPQMAGETDYERAAIDLWKKLDKYRRVIAAQK